MQLDRWTDWLIYVIGTVVIFIFFAVVIDIFLLGLIQIIKEFTL